MPRFVTLTCVCLLLVGVTGELLAVGNETVGDNKKSINVNPGSQGEPWWLAPTIELSNADQARLRELRRLVLPPLGKKSLPATVDNSQHPYLRPVFTQSHGSCGQASGIGYAFTYELNYRRGTPANSADNQYPTHFTYNYLNSGSGNSGSLYLDGWHIVEAAGCPNVTSYGGLANLGAQGWMNGYDKYLGAMNNRSL